MNLKYSFIKRKVRSKYVFISSTCGMVSMFTPMSFHQLISDYYCYNYFTPGLLDLTINIKEEKGCRFYKLSLSPQENSLQYVF